MESVVAALPTDIDFINADAATFEQLELAHSIDHINDVKNEGVFDIASMAAGGAIHAARIGLNEPCFALIRPPGHHASAGSAWGFCYFNNMAVSLLTLKSELLIKTAFVLDIDLHYGDGTDNILGTFNWVETFNPETNNRKQYLNKVKEVLSGIKVDIIGISAGFDNHKDDWGGLLSTEDYFVIGKMVKETSKLSDAGCFALMEGGYNHKVLGQNVTALINGLSV